MHNSGRVNGTNSIRISLEVSGINNNPQHKNLVLMHHRIKTFQKLMIFQVLIGELKKKILF